MRHLAANVLGLVIVALVVAGVAAGIAKRRFDGPGPAAGPVTVVIPKGSKLADTSELLAGAGAISDATLFRLGVAYSGHARELKAGEYEIAPHASMKDVLGKLVSGDVVEHKITVAEGLTSAEVVDILNASDVLTGKIGDPPAEGSLAPDTYFVNRGDSREDLIGRMQAEQTKILDAAWAARAPELPIASKEDALILASIVEKETGIAGERAKIAGVFVNRLKLGMPLQSDPTVIYALTGGKAPLGRGLTTADLRNPSKYNSYMNTGLPPGPICNPGRDAIRAVVNPADTKDLYFVADGTGGHAFSATLAEHDQNVARWRAIERGRRQAAEQVGQGPDRAPGKRAETGGTETGGTESGQ